MTVPWKHTTAIFAFRATSPDATAKDVIRSVASSDTGKLFKLMIDFEHNGYDIRDATIHRRSQGSSELKGGKFTVEARLVTHTEESYATRLGPASGAGLVYSGDCGVADDLAPLIRPGDTLLVEASFGPGPVPKGVNHLDAPAIARLAEATSPGQILLTHIQMGFDREAALRTVAAATPAPVRLVEPGDRYRI